MSLVHVTYDPCKVHVTYDPYYGERMVSDTVFARVGAAEPTAGSPRALPWLLARGGARARGEGGWGGAMKRKQKCTLWKPFSLSEHP